MALNINDIADIIKQQIKTYDQKLTMNETGTIVTIGAGIALVYGLENAVLGELIEFPGHVFGMVLNLEENAVGIALLGESTALKEGDIVKRTKKVVQVPVGDALVGRVVNALGQPIDEQGAIKTNKTRPIERIAPGVMTRASVDQPLATGILAIDAMIPIGKGQRELIIGDRQTGKTAMAIDTILNQKGRNVRCVYVAIGQKASTVAQIVDKLKQTGAADYSTVVMAGASEPSTLQYIAPYAGMAIAEEWMENGEDVLIIFDDLSKHAVAYRTLSLLLRRPPGREAYPGDVFYLHSRLLERAAKLNKELGGGSITALPVIETLAGDISAYIPTNVISITDGQIFLITDLFNKGIRPAVDLGLSVSRVGSAAQIKAVKQMAGSLKLELAQYRELEAFARFGSDLDENTKAILANGQRLMELIKQPQYLHLSQTEEALLLLAAKARDLRWLPVEMVSEFKTSLVNHFNRDTAAKTIIKALRHDLAFNPALEAKASAEIAHVLFNLVSRIDKYDHKVYGSDQAWAELQARAKTAGKPATESKPAAKAETEPKAKPTPKAKTKPAAAPSPKKAKK